jgi:hypothetical protein
MFKWLGIVCGSLVGLVVLWLVVGVVRLVLRYRRSPERRWCQRILKLMETAHRRALAEREGMQQAGVHHAQEDQALRDRAFQTFLRSIPVSELDAYPGIGPATVGKLQDAGYADLAALHHASLPGLGLGQKRLADVENALRDLVEQAHSRFEAGACPEARELAVRLEVLRASRSEQGARATERYLAAVEVMQKLEPLAQAAERFNLPVYLRPELESVDFPALMQRKLPDLDRAIQAADDRAGREYATRQQAAPAAPPAAQPAPAAESLRTAGPRAAAALATNPIAPTVPSHVPVDLFQKSLQATPPLKPAAPPPPGPPANDAAPADDAVVRLQLTVEFAFAVARADGRIARKERAVIEDYLRRRWWHDPVLRNRAKAFCAQYESGLLDLDACLWHVTARFSPEERRDLLEFAGAIADASGERNQREQALLERIAHKLAVPLAPQPAAPPQPFQEMPAAAPTPEDGRVLLEIDSSIALSADLVRRQYHLLMERYAAEKVASLGPDFIAMAEGKRATIRAAAVALLEPFGEPLTTAPPAAAPQELRHNPDLDAMFGA